MYEYYPLLVVLAVVSVIAALFIIAYAMMKDKKQSIGFDRNMKDSEIFLRSQFRNSRHYISPF